MKNVKKNYLELFWRDFYEHQFKKTEKRVIKMYNEQILNE